MGRKDAAREIAVAAGVPVVPAANAVRPPGHRPSSATRCWSRPRPAAAARACGSSAIRGELRRALAAARREARRAFGDDTMLVEKYVEHGRHIEVQVLADAHGTRRAPLRARLLDPAPPPEGARGGARRRRSPPTSARAGSPSAAVALARQVGYVNAGTVEFLLDADTGEVYFLEMNTRLQVEHPVTEAVIRTGDVLDLVELQLLVAAGEPLPITQDDVTIDGHAIEARVYAEDSFGGFLPQAGTAERACRWPDAGLASTPRSSGPGRSARRTTRCSARSSPTAPTREAARRALVAALDDTAILGLTTNLGFLRGLVASDAFSAFEIDIAYLDTHPDAIHPDGRAEAAVLAAWALSCAPGPSADSSNPFGVADGWRATGPAAPIPVQLLVDAETVVFAVDRGGSVSSGDRTWTVHPIASESGVLRLEIDNLVHEAAVRIGRHRVDVALRGNTYIFELPGAFGPATHRASSDGAILAPMPGTVLSVPAGIGQRVAEGEILAVMEAMKMELALKAPFDGTVTEAAAVAGAQVALGARLFVVEARPAEEQ